MLAKKIPQLFNHGLGRSLIITRRGFLEVAGGAIAFAGTAAEAASASDQHAALLWLSPLLPAGVRAEAALESLPGKKPLIRLTERPPNYEAPLSYLRTPITPNDQFFVRYHVADIPQVDGSTWKLSVGGEGANRDLQIGLEELKKLPSFEIAAVCQCAGRGRGLFQPHVAGVQWGKGAMGCARWKGARLKDVLNLVGLKEDAVEIVFDGADAPLLDKSPDFVKSVPVWKAIEETTLIAYEMNGGPLPHWNGFPARIVLPGWVATYWLKHLTKITAVTKPFDGFFMKSGYRIPVGKFPLVERFSSQETATNTPVTEILVNSLVTSPQDGARVRVRDRVTISGIAWDGGYGIRSVEISADNGETWAQARLGEDLGKFAFRPWRYDVTPKERGKLVVAARATNKLGQTQTEEPIQNPSGSLHSAIQIVTLDVV